MAYGECKDLERRKQSDNILTDKAFEITNNPKYDGYQKGLASMIFNFFDKRTSGGEIKAMSNQQLAEELHEPIIREF